MNKENILEQNFLEVVNHFKKIKTSSLLSKCIKMDFQLLNLTCNDGLNFGDENGIFPGNNSFLNAITFLNQLNYVGRDCTKQDIIFLSKKLDQCSLNTIKTRGRASINAIVRPQLDWQKKYIFKTYLLYLIISQKEVFEIYRQSFPFSAIELSGICLFNKLLSTDIVASFLLKVGIGPSDTILNFINFFYKYFPFVSISIEDYQRKQYENFRKSNFDFFSTRLLIRDYPIVVTGNEIFPLSYFYIQNSLYSRLIYFLAQKGTNSKLIGNAYERVIFDSFKKCYSHIENDCLNDDCIQLNPHTKKAELCDILIKNKDKYLLVDCKAKEFIETIYNENSKEIAIFDEKFLQRFERINDIKSGKFCKYFPKGVDVTKIYSLVAVVDDCGYSKSLCLETLQNKLKMEDLDYCEKHIDFINYDDLLELINSDVDIIYIMQRNIEDGKYKNPIITSIKQTDKSKYHIDFDNWYKDAASSLIELIEKYKILPLK